MPPARVPRGFRPCGAGRAALGWIRDIPAKALNVEELRRLAMSPDAFTAETFFLSEGEVWKAPAGAYRRCGGPS
jgi:hypothetical protein